MSKILTTHVGSLPRSKGLSEILFSKDRGEKFIKEDFNNILKKNVETIVKKQIEVGIDYISDGEMSKISYATYIKDRIDGFSGESERRAPADLDDFPEYKEKIAKSGGTPTYSRPCCTNALKIKDKDLYSLAQKHDLSEICITSSALLLNDNNLENEIEVTSSKAVGKKCPVCWKIRENACERHSNCHLS